VGGKSDGLEFATGRSVVTSRPRWVDLDWKSLCITVFLAPPFLMLFSQPMIDTAFGLIRVWNVNVGGPNVQGSEKVGDVMLKTEVVLPRLLAENFIQFRRHQLPNHTQTYIYISQGNAETHLRCGEIYNNHIIANCPQTVLVKKLWKSVNNWRRYKTRYMPRFLWLTVYIEWTHWRQKSC